MIDRHIEVFIPGVPEKNTHSYHYTLRVHVRGKNGQYRVKFYSKAYNATRKLEDPLWVDGDRYAKETPTVFTDRRKAKKEARERMQKALEQTFEKFNGYRVKNYPIVKLA